MDNITIEHLHDAAQQLACSHRGRAAMTGLLAWMDQFALGLDAANQSAVLTLLEGAWCGFAGTARDVMREALSEEPQ